MLRAIESTELFKKILKVHEKNQKNLEYVLYIVNEEQNHFIAERFKILFDGTFGEKYECVRSLEKALKSNTCKSLVTNEFDSEGCVYFLLEDHISESEKERFMRNIQNKNPIEIFKNGCIAMKMFLPEKEVTHGKNGSKKTGS